jgi:hypothetical protein
MRVPYLRQAFAILRVESAKLPMMPPMFLHRYNVPTVDTQETAAVRRIVPTMVAITVSVQM